MESGGQRVERQENRLSLRADRALLELVEYGVTQGLLPKRDRTYAHNRLLAVFGVTGCQEPAHPLQEPVAEEALPAILDILLQEAEQRGLIPEGSPASRDLFDTRLMDCILPPPSQVEADFWKHWNEDPKQATDWYYAFSQNSHYIRRERIQRDRHWTVQSEYGEIEISINLSKPEKDPRAIAEAGRTQASGYPACLLCRENEGYAGHLQHPARQNHRMIQLPLQDRSWFLQYSPYVYYNEHCIFLHAEHHPMRIDRSCFDHLLSLVDTIPQYFAGSNADLPIVGGSILAHEHFQGGGHVFPMQKAEWEEWLSFSRYPEVQAGWVRWPMTVLRLRSENRVQLLDLASEVLAIWREYSDAAVGILAYTDQTPHNTITPIARKLGAEWELDLVLRNNRTDEAHPLGIFHPRTAFHPVKKENIGLIEVMGLAILPARLEAELGVLEEALEQGRPLAGEPLQKHADWVERARSVRPVSSASSVRRWLEEEVGAIFVQVLEDAGVYKRDAVGMEARARLAATLQRG